MCMLEMGVLRRGWLEGTNDQLDVKCLDLIKNSEESNRRSIKLTNAIYNSIDQGLKSYDKLSWICL